MKKQLLLFASLILFLTQLCYAQTPVLWGTTTVGGAYGVGSIFVRDTAGTCVNEHSFGPTQADGFNSWGALLHAGNGLLYGMTLAGGANDSGTIFSYNIATGVENVVHSFSSDTDGNSPYGSLIQVGDSLLYGLTYGGGVYGVGTIFSYNIYTGIEKNLYNFGSSDTDGAHPAGTLCLANDSLLYGLTKDGGYYNTGTIFSYNIATGVETMLYKFAAVNKNDGQNPIGSLIQATNGRLYGMTPYGGAYQDGTIFNFYIPTRAEQVLYQFGQGGLNDGNTPFGSLIQLTDTSLYGLTAGGGAGNAGILFSFNPTDSKLGLRYNFSATITDANSPNGSLLAASDNLLYGTSFFGGANNNGTIFSFNPQTNTEAVVFSFDSLSGISPSCTLIEVDSPTAGVNKLTVDDGRFTVYPNPTTGQFTIKLPCNQNGYTVEVYNELGQMVLSISSSAQPARPVNLAAQPPGLYFVFLKSNNAIEAGKVVVTK